jgi:hypothetical protein
MTGTGDRLSLKPHENRLDQLQDRFLHGLIVALAPFSWVVSASSVQSPVLSLQTTALDPDPINHPKYMFLTLSLNLPR